MFPDIIKIELFNPVEQYLKRTHFLETLLQKTFKTFAICERAYNKVSYFQEKFLGKKPPFLCNPIFIVFPFLETVLWESANESTLADNENAFHLCKDFSENFASMLLLLKEKMS